MSIRVGVDIGGTKLLVLTEHDGVEETQIFPTGPGFTGAEVEVLLHQVLARLPGPPASIGIAVPGLVGAKGEVVTCDVIRGLEGWKPAPDIRTGALLNDAEAALRAAIEGTPEGQTAGVVMVGTAIGAAFLVDGRPLRGACGWAGELGSLPLPAEGGVRTLDQLAGGAPLRERLRDLSPDDPQHGAAVEAAGGFLGLGLAAVINLLNPHRLVVAGGTLRWPGYYEAAERAARRHSLPDLWQACSMERSPRADTRVAYGALLAASRLG